MAIRKCKMCGGDINEGQIHGTYNSETKDRSVHNNSTKTRGENGWQVRFFLRSGSRKVLWHAIGL